jgi:gas vesicle protein
MARNDDFSSFMSGVTMGVIAGVVAGLLLAPKPGTETKEDIKRAWQKLTDEAEDTYAKAVKKLNRKVNQLKALGDKIDQTKYKALVTEVVEELKQDSKVTSEVAKKLTLQLSSDWEIVKDTVAKK